MTDLMKIVLALTVSGTALAAALALLRRILKEKLPKAVFYYLWLLVLLRLIVPVALPVPGLERAMEPPAVEVTPPISVQAAPGGMVGQPIPIDPSDVQTVPADTVITGNGLELSFQQEQPTWYEGAWAFLCENFAPIWLIGAAMHFLWFAFSYFRFSHGLKQDCTPLLEQEQALLDNLRGDMPVAACRSGVAQTPMLLGLLRPRIVLPETAINTRELECILRHELTHLRRRDLLYKWFTVAVTSFHWFNPLMPWLRKEISRACELSCDEGVIGAMDDEHKRLYGETLLALAAANALPRAVPATTLCEEKKQLRERLLGIKKYHKTTLWMAVLSVLLALLVAGCAAVLGPQLKKETFTGPLTEEQQAPVLENIKAWAEENIQVDDEITVTYSEPNDQPQSMGMLAEIATTHLYDLSSDTVRPVDGIYPDSEQLGHMTLMVKDGETVRDIQVFYLTNGDPAKGTSPVESLEQFAIAYPKAKANYLSWEQREGQPLYIKMFFIHEGKESIFEYSGVCGRWGVRERETASDKRAAIPADALPQMMDRIIQWQIDNGGDTDGRNFTLVNGMTLETPASHGILDQFLDDWQTVQVYNMATGDLYTLEGDYTGAVEYGCFTLLNVEEPRKWVFLIDNNDAALTGRVAVVTEDTMTPWFEDASTGGEPQKKQLELKRGTLVYVQKHDGTTCEVTVLTSQRHTTVEAAVLSADMADLKKANQVILNDTPVYDAAGAETPFGRHSGVVGMGLRNGPWWQVYLDDLQSGWVKEEELTYQWPLPYDTNLTGQVAVLTKNAPLDNAFAQTVDTEGRTVVMDMAMALKKGDLVYVESQEGETCAVTVLAGEPPRVQGQLDASILSVEQAHLENANQVILKDAKMWHGDPDEGVFSDSACTGVANVERRKTVTRDSWSPEGTVQTQEDWYCVTLPGGDNAFWARRVDLSWEWPLAVPAADLSGKVFVYEKEGFGGNFTISLQDDGTFSYYEGLLSSHLGWGTWTVEGDTLTLREDTFSRVFRFRIQDDSLYYIKKSSSPFTYIQLEDGARFPENGAEYAAALGYDEVRWERRPDGSLGSRFLLARKGEHWGLLDGQGNTLLAPEAYQLDAISLNTYEEVWPIISVSKDGLYGAIDYNGNLVIEPQWQEVRMYCYDQPDMVFLRDGYQWYGVRLSYDRYTDVYTYSGMQVSQPFEALHLIPEFQIKTAAWLEQEFHRVYDPYYDLQELIISDWDQASGSEATFHYKMTWLNYNRDPDTVAYVTDAKKQSQSTYETLYNDYLALKEGNYSFKIVWEGDTPTLYTDVSVKDGPEWELTAVQNFVVR